MQEGSAPMWYAEAIVTLKAGSVPPGTTTEKMRCPRCDELLRNLNGGRGNRNHRKRPSSSGSRNVAVNRNQRAPLLAHQQLILDNHKFV